MSNVILKAVWCVVEQYAIKKPAWLGFAMQARYVVAGFVLFFGLL